MKLSKDRLDHISCEDNTVWMLPASDSVSNKKVQKQMNLYTSWITQHPHEVRHFRTQSHDMSHTCDLIGFTIHQHNPKTQLTSLIVMSSNQITDGYKHKFQSDKISYKTHLNDRSNSVSTFHDITLTYYILINSNMAHRIFRHKHIDITHTKNHWAL